MKIPRSVQLFSLRDILNRKGITQTELANETGINYSNLNLKINGRMPLSFSEAIRICRVLNIKLSDISGDYVTNTEHKLAK